MRFEYAPAGSYQDLGSGHVLYSAPGFPSFPARLGIELFERARRAADVVRPVLWDPMCGAGGIVTTLGLARGEAIGGILASDISVDAVALARRNLELTSREGLSRRIEALRGRGADTARIASAERLLEQIGGRTVAYRTAVADVTDTASILGIDPGVVDVVLTDLPYEAQTRWQTAVREPVVSMLETLWHVLPRHAVVVMAAIDRKAFASAPAPFRAFKHGHRTIKMFRAP